MALEVAAGKFTSSGPLSLPVPSVIVQVCDDEWHHYAVNVDFPSVNLVVDGEEWLDQKDNPEIIDDWPLHPAGDITTKTVIGACWQGKDKDVLSKADTPMGPNLK